MQKSFLQKLSRKTIFITLFAALAVIAIVVFFRAPPLVTLLKHPLCRQPRSAWVIW